MDKYTVISKISIGSEGTVYKVIKNNKYYAMKISHILKIDIPKSLESIHWREIDFANNLNKKHPDHFMKLYDYDIINNCNKKYFTMDVENINPIEVRNSYINLLNSGYCSRKIYNYVQYDLNNHIEKLNLNQIYSGIIQVAFIIFLIRQSGYYHNDLGPNNIGINKTNKKYLNILGHKIPTFGYIFIALDYGKVFHDKFILRKKEKNLAILNHFRTIFNTYSIKFLLLHDFDTRYKLSSYTDCYDSDIIYKNFNNHDIKKIIEMYTKDESMQLTLCELLFPHIFQKISLKILPKNYNNNKTIVPKEDIIFILTHIENVELVINYLALKVFNDI
jgi:hypothetical protein